MIGWLVTKQEMGLGEGGWGLLGETQTESRALLGGRALVSLKKSLSIVVKLRVLCRATLMNKKIPMTNCQRL